MVPARHPGKRDGHTQGYGFICESAYGPGMLVYMPVICWDAVGLEFTSNDFVFLCGP